MTVDLKYIYIYIIESVDSISRDERDVPLTQYITNAEAILIIRHPSNIIFSGDT